MKSLSDFIYGYGESNSLAFEAFVCLRTMKTITAAREANGYISCT